MNAARNSALIRWTASKKRSSTLLTRFYSTLFRFRTFFGTILIILSLLLTRLPNAPTITMQQLPTNSPEVIPLVEGAVLKTTSTDPSFQIWLYPPKTDIISEKIIQKGLYEPEEIEFADIVVATCAATSTGDNNDSAGWAVDIGANIGFHTIYMAAIGMNVIAFEPATDTAGLLQKSIAANGFENGKSNNDNTYRNHPTVHVVRAAAGERNGFGRLVRHKGSSGMTVLQPYSDHDSDDNDKAQEHAQNGAVSNAHPLLPFGVEMVVGDNIPIVRPEDILQERLPTTGTTIQKQRNNHLWLVKFDAEGHELHALKGLNLEKFPFSFLAFEFFPELLQRAGGTDPLELLLFVASYGYVCSTKPSSLRLLLDDNNNNDKATNTAKQGKGRVASLLETTDDFREWYEKHAAPLHKKYNGYHINLYCKRTGD